MTRDATSRYDLLVAAEAGLCSVTGNEAGEARIGVSACDILAGLNGYAAVLRALHARARTGEGASISVSLFDAAAEVMAVPYAAG